MFHWICPECGREIPPSVRECAACDPTAPVVEASPATQATTEPLPAPPPLPAVEHTHGHEPAHGYEQSIAEILSVPRPAAAQSAESPIENGVAPVTPELTPTLEVRSVAPESNHQPGPQLIPLPPPLPAQASQ